MENRKKILCLEDNAMLQDIMKIPLKSKNIGVDFARDYGQLSEILKTLSDHELKEYKAILLDAEVNQFNILANRIIEKNYPCEKIYIYGTSEPQVHGGIDLPAMYLPKMNITLMYYLSEYFAGTE